MEVIQANLPGSPALDIMVPTHNRIDLTMKCLQAIYFHTQSPFHVIVCDDSWDGLTPLYFQKLLTEG
ncbi:MAG TPA: glycosyltransferase family A protein, partial [Dehalococcoidia bacterium]|nr:glycosyltransferase family A protein [Dehalococcoidia bacterium]